MVDDAAWKTNAVFYSFIDAQTESPACAVPAIILNRGFKEVAYQGHQALPRRERTPARLRRGDQTFNVGPKSLGQLEHRRGQLAQSSRMAIQNNLSCSAIARSMANCIAEILR